MKILIKKILLFTLIAVMLVTGTAILTACYTSKPAKMSKVVGTYALDTYKTKLQGTGDWVDAKAEQGIEAYLVVTGNGYGYYVYKDKTEGVKAETVKLTYSYDSDDPTLVAGVEYDCGYEKSHGHPGGGRENLLYNKSKKRLARKNPAFTVTVFGQEVGSKYATDVVYKKVDSATDLTYVNKKFSASFKPIRYEMKNLNGIFYASPSWYAEFDYIYYYIALRADAMKADVYYALKADGVRQKTENVDVSYSKGPFPVLSVGEAVYLLVGDEPSNVFRADDYSIYFYKFYGLDNIDELIENALRDYEGETE